MHVSNESIHVYLLMYFSFLYCSGGYSLKEGHIDHLNKMLDRAYGHQWTGDLKTEKLKSVMNWVLECIKESDCLTIFDIRREIHMDKKILSALLKGHDMRLVYY